MLNEGRELGGGGGLCQMKGEREKDLFMILLNIIKSSSGVLVLVPTKDEGRHDVT